MSDPACPDCGRTHPWRDHSTEADWVPLEPESRNVTLRAGDDVGRMLRFRGGLLRFYGLTIGWFGVGVVRYEPAIAEGSVSSLVRDVPQREPVETVNSGQGAVTDPSTLPDVRRLAAAMRTVDVIEQRPVESYVALATEIVAAYLALDPSR